MMFRRLLTLFRTTLVTEKIKALPGINPYVINWVITFFKDCK